MTKARIHLARLISRVEEPRSLEEMGYFKAHLVVIFDFDWPQHEKQ